MQHDSISDLLNKQRLGFKLMFESNPSPMWIFDEDTLEYLAVNNAAAEKYGFSAEEFLSLKITDIRDEYEYAALQQAIANDSGIYGPDQAWHRKRDGTLFKVEITAQSLAFQGRHIRLALVRDLTEKIRDQEKLRESEELFRAVFNQASVGIAVISHEGYYLNANARFTQITGYSMAELAGLTHQDITHPADMQNQSAALLGLLERRHRSYEWEKRYIRKDGSRIWVKLSASLMHQADGSPLNYVAIVEDITEAKQANARIREQASWIDMAHDAIIVCGLDHRILFWNGGAEALYGWTEDETIGRDLKDLLALNPAEFDAAMNSTLTLGDWKGEARQSHKDGSDRTAQSHWSLILDDSGAPKSILIISTDITERLVLERQLRQSQRLESLGQLTGGIAHDFNNLLTVILGSIEMLAEGIAHLPDQLALAETASAAALRGAELTRQLLAFTQRQMLAPRPVDINRCITDALGMIRRALREEVEIKVIGTENIWNCSIDTSQFQNALLNLCINASDAMNGPGFLQIETSNVVLDDIYAGRNEGITPGDYVMVSVSDDGSGISQENLFRVFDPFFTTKPVGKGTGLGLSMVYGFVKQSKGHIKIYSELGLGTTVKMYFPKSDPRDASATTLNERDMLQGRGGAVAEKILLVEDDNLVRSQAEGQLARLGYRVISASNGADALEIIRKTPDIDLLLTDVIMPGGMNGRQLAEQALAVKPALKILYSSGYTENILYSDGRLDPTCLVLSKPYSRLELQRKILAALSQGGP